MITPIQSNGASALNNALNIERIRVPRRINFKGIPQIQPQAEQLQQNQDKFIKQVVK